MARASLPDATTPMQLADGTVLVPSVVSTFQRNEVLSNSAAQRLVSSTRRKLVEMPALPKQLNSFSALLVYTMSGLGDDEISIATGFTREQIAWMRSQAAYEQLQSYMIEAVREQAQADVKSILVKGTTRAANRVVELIDSEDDKVAFAAAKDLLDRDGHKAAEKVDIRAAMLNTFRIEVVDKREAAPIIDMETL